MTSNQPVRTTSLVDPATESDFGASAGFGSMIEHVAPLSPAAAGMLLGIACDNLIRASPRASWVAYTFALILGAVIFRLRGLRSVSRTVGLFAMAIGVGGLLHLNAQRAPDPNGIAQHATRDASIIRLTGIVVSEPRILIPRETPFSRWSFRRESMSFVLRAESVATTGGWMPTCDRLRVIVREPILDLRVGEPIEITGFLSPLTPPRNPGAFDWSNWQRRQGVAASLTCPHRENVQRQNPHAVRRDSWISAFRARAVSLVSEGTVGADEESGLLDALVLGQRSQIDRSVNDAFVKAGCVHFLAASGTNVAMVASFVWFLARWVRLTRRGGALCVFATILLYALVAEPRPPILRAAITGSLFCAAVAVGRERSVLNWLSAAAIVLLLVDPTTAFDLGFQLSFLAVLGVAYLTGPIAYFLSGDWLAAWWVNRREHRSSSRTMSPRSRFGLADQVSPVHKSDEAPLDATTKDQTDRFPRSVWWVWPRRIAAVYLAASLGAWLASLPVVAGTFHRIQPYGAIGSCVALPLVYLAMVIGFVRAAIAFVLPVGGEILGLLLGDLVATLLAVVRRLADLPGASLEVTTPPWWWTATFYGQLAAIVLRRRMFIFDQVRRPLSDRTPGEVEMRSIAERGADVLIASRASRTETRGRVFRAVVVTLAFACAVATGAWAWPRQSPERLTITVLSVGDGSAAVLELPDGQTVLVDGGSRSFADVGRDVVRPFLSSRGIRAIDEVVLTRARLDRFSGIPNALETSTNVPLRTAPGFEDECALHGACRALLKLIESSGHRVQSEETATGGWERGGATFQWVSAPRSPVDEGRTDSAALLRVEFAGYAMLFAPDLDRRNCSAFAGIEGRSSDVLIAPARGLDAAECSGFLDRVRASVLVRTYSKGGNGDAPSRSGSTTARLVLDVEAGGAVRITVDTSGVRSGYAMGEPHD